MNSSPALPADPAFSPAEKCVLVVEDELLIRWAVSDALREAGFRVIEACSADEALEIFAADPPDIVISDVRMPGSLDGLGLLAIIRKTYPVLPVIIVSGHLQPAAALADGATYFLQKPYVLHTVLEVVAAELGKSDD